MYTRAESVLEANIMRSYLIREPPGTTLTGDKKKNGGRRSKNRLSRGVLCHLFPYFIDMHDHVEGRAGEAVTLPVEGIDRELHDFVRYRRSRQLLEIDQVAGIQPDLIAEFPEFLYPAL